MVKAIKITLILIAVLPHTVTLADSASALDELKFQDSSAFVRAKNFRSLSLLTLADLKNSRLYLGVNKRGFLGIHYGAATKNDNRHLEVARMPYLRKTRTE